jgi:membrane protease YdiL (CAAX protease family)
MDLLAIWFLVIFGVFVPYIAHKSGQRMRRWMPATPRKRIFLNILIMQAVFLLIALFVAKEREILLFVPGRLTPRAVVAAFAMLVIALSVMRFLWQRSSAEEKRRMLIVRPNEPKDLPWWFLVSLAAGTIEEIIYRGVMVSILLPMTRNWWTAVAICVLFFSLGHANQGLRRGIFIAAIAFGAHMLVWMTGALYLAMALHFSYDFIAGILYLRWAQRLQPAPSFAPVQNV